VGRRTFHEGKLDGQEQRATASTTHPPPPFQTRGGLLHPARAPFSRLRKQLVNGMRDGYVREGRGLGPCAYRNAPVAVCVGCERSDPWSGERSQNAICRKVTTFPQLFMRQKRKTLYHYCTALANWLACTRICSSGLLCSNAFAMEGSHNHDSRCQGAASEAGEACQPEELGPCRDACVNPAKGLHHWTCPHAQSAAATSAADDPDRLYVDEGHAILARLNVEPDDSRGLYSECDPVS
jgi:hypothetical protein